MSPVEGCIATALMISHSMSIMSACWVKKGNNNTSVISAHAGVSGVRVLDSAGTYFLRLANTLCLIHH